MADGSPWEPNMTFVTPQLAVGGSFPAGRAADLAAHHGIRAVVDLRAEARDDEVELTDNGVVLLHLPTEDMCAVSLPMLEEGVVFVGGHLAQGAKVLVHCEYGIGRSATLALCALVAEGLAPLEALALAKEKRDRVSPSPPQFEAWAGWLAAHRVRTGAAWEVPTFEEFAAIAYRRAG